MTTDAQQAAINAAAIVWLGAALESIGVEEPVNRAERIVAELIKRGIGHAEPAPSMRPSSVATAEQRRAHIAAAKAALRRSADRASATLAQEAPSVAAGPPGSPSRGY